MDDLIRTVGKYALRKGEVWRIGEGAEIMDAYQSATTGAAAEEAGMVAACPHCKGSGRAPADDPQEGISSCAKCEGIGALAQPASGEQAEKVYCPECQNHVRTDDKCYLSHKETS